MTTIIAALGAFTAFILLINTVLIGIVARHAARAAVQATRASEQLTRVEILTNGRLDQALTEIAAAHLEVKRLMMLLTQGNAGSLQEGDDCNGHTRSDQFDHPN